MSGYRITFSAPWIKKLIVYWVAMCILFGVAQGIHWRDCPDDAVPFSDLVQFAVAWPIVIGLALTAPSDRPKHCTSKP